MENDNRSRNNPYNGLIYQHLKEEEILQLTDKEFEILQTKLKPITSSGEHAAFYDFYTGSDAKGLKGDEIALNVYKRIMANHHFYFDCNYRYSQTFTLAHNLGVTNIYDIGCGQQLQALLLMQSPEMNYTGIDPLIFSDYVDEFFAEPSYINELFESFTRSDRIKYIKDTYPCDLAVGENNIAILFYLLCTNEEKIKTITTSLSNDFERVVFMLPFREFNLTDTDIKDIIYNEVEVWKNPYEEYYSIWKNAMPDYEFYKIGEPNCIFATKIAEDREKLERNYTIVDNRIMTGVIDIPFHVALRG